ncbi:MAG TPA: hypothetical protein DCL77_01760 [Prolixibacteraceae bacterium]|nr:hypothetical protein [Prolixibacteraceae bacterium]
MPLSRVTPENIVSLEETQVFVFGSNMAGRHGGGAARLAYERFGARMGMGWGYVGSSYAIPTKDINIQTLPINEIFPWVHTFIESVKDSHLTFLVTEIGCGLAGYEPKDIAPLFKEAMDVPNIHLPLRFWEILINL